VTPIANQTVWKQDSHCLAAIDRIITEFNIQDDRDVKSKYSGLLIENYSDSSELKLDQLLLNWDKIQAVELVSTRQEAQAKIETSFGDKQFIVLDYGFYYKTG